MLCSTTLPFWMKFYEYSKSCPQWKYSLMERLQTELVYGNRNRARSTYYYESTQSLDLIFCKLAGPCIRTWKGEINLTFISALSLDLVAISPSLFLIWSYSSKSKFLTPIVVVESSRFLFLMTLCVWSARNFPMELIVAYIITIQASVCLNDTCNVLDEAGRLVNHV